MEIGFIGLGNLGVVMVENLIERGYKLHLYNRTAAKMEVFKERAALHSSLQSIAQACDVLISIVSDDKAVEAIVYGTEGLLQHMKENAVHVNLSTISAALSAKLQSAHNDNKLEYLTATIIGRPEAAKMRNLNICYSGSSKRKDEIRTVLNDLGGNKVFEFGDDARTAAVIKVCNNFLIISAIEAMGEAFTMAENSGADPNAFYEMITDTIFNSVVYKNYGKIIIEKTYDQKGGFTSELGLKDTRLALALAEESSSTLPLGDLLRNRFLINHKRNRQDWDWTSIVEVIKEEGKAIS
jgi:3-hydroxyisobutyrate dehydrogenase-like beta-hydroxyacid dehydrogenase